jgi:hypothetical protein
MKQTNRKIKEMESVNHKKQKKQSVIQEERLRSCSILVSLKYHKEKNRIPTNTV